jgi:hypothetical protein
MRCRLPWVPWPEAAQRQNLHRQAPCHATHVCTSWRPGKHLSAFVQTCCDDCSSRGHKGGFGQPHTVHLVGLCSLCRQVVTTLCTSGGTAFPLSHSARRLSPECTKSGCRGPSAPAACAQGVPPHTAACRFGIELMLNMGVPAAGNGQLSLPCSDDAGCLSHVISHSLKVNASPCCALPDASCDRAKPLQF